MAVNLCRPQSVWGKKLSTRYQVGAISQRWLQISCFFSPQVRTIKATGSNWVTLGSTTLRIVKHCLGKTSVKTLFAVNSLSDWIFFRKQRNWLRKKYWQLFLIAACQPCQGGFLDRVRVKIESTDKFDIGTVSPSIFLKI